MAILRAFRRIFTLSNDARKTQAGDAFLCCSAGGAVAFGVFDGAGMPGLPDDTGDLFAAGKNGF